MTNAEKFTEVFGTELYRKYSTKSWWDQEFVPNRIIPTGWIPVSVIEDIKSEINELSELNHIEPTYEDCKRDVLEILDKYKTSPTGAERNDKE